MSPRTLAGVSAGALAVAAGLLAACSSTHPRRVPLGEALPPVVGKSLAGDRVRLPADLSGEPAVLLIGYVQDAQFDLDRWILGLVQLQTPVRVIEVPTIEGLVPGMFAGRIDEGMRGGIPTEDWAAVVTVYGKEAVKIAEWTGTERPRNGRVLLLDAQGRVAWFHDRGYSAGWVTQLDALARELLDGSSPAGGPSPPADRSRP